MWSWILHRATGIGVLLFLLIHILDTSLIKLGPEVYNRMVRIYRHPLFRFMEVGLFASVLYHALNGIRIIIIDFVPAAAVHQKKMFWVGAAIFLIALIPVSFLMLSPIFKLH